jgi:hypothetical protein
MVGYLALALALLPTTRIAGGVLQVAQTVGTVEITRKRHVTASELTLLTLLGFFAGIAVGLLLLGFLGAQGLAVGAALALCGAALPFAIYEDGWDKRWVHAINGQTLRCLRTVFMFAGMGGSPVEQALRIFADTWAERSALADLILECPQNADPVAFLADLALPGQPYAVMVMALQQAQAADLQQRGLILEQALVMALSDLKSFLKMLAKKRAMTAIIVAVTILLPTLLLAVLAPPASGLIGVINF